MSRNKLSESQQEFDKPEHGDIALHTSLKNF